MKKYVRRYGFHFSITNGLTGALEEAVKLGVNAMQIFPGNPRGWEQKPFLEKDVEEFIKKREELDIKPVVIHMPYLPNLASPDKTLYKRSVEILKDTMLKAEQIKAEFVNTHAGNRKDSDSTSAIKRLVDACMEGLSQLSLKSNVMLLIENGAGTGSEIGVRFEEIAEILSLLNDKRTGVCFDTAHAFGAGYDLRTPVAIKKTFNEFDKIIGLSRLKVIHYNDSLVPLASKKDRHQHIGKGLIGKEGMNAIFNFSKFRDLPFIMETPVNDEGDDLMNLKTVKFFMSDKK